MDREMTRQQPELGYGNEDGEVDYYESDETRTMSSISEQEWPIVGN
jgi:hypothetical protein